MAMARVSTVHPSMASWVAHVASPLRIFFNDAGS
jgi:hypothetical protein